MWSAKKSETRRPSISRARTSRPRSTSSRRPHPRSSTGVSIHKRACVRARARTHTHTATTTPLLCSVSTRPFEAYSPPQRDVQLSRGKCAQCLDIEKFVVKSAPAALVSFGDCVCQENPFLFSKHGNWRCLFQDMCQRLRSRGSRREVSTGAARSRPAQSAPPPPPQRPTPRGRPAELRSGSPRSRASLPTRTGAPFSSS